MKSSIDYVDQVILNFRQYSVNEMSYILMGLQPRREAWKLLDEKTLETLKNIDFEIKSFPVLMTSAGSGNSAAATSNTNLAVTPSTTDVRI